MAPNKLSIFGLNNVIYAGLNIVTVNTEYVGGKNIRHTA